MSLLLEFKSLISFFRYSHNIFFLLKSLLEGLVQFFFINYSPSRRSKPVRFWSSSEHKRIYSIFFMKSESFLSLHWQLCNYHFDISKSPLCDRKTNPYKLSGLVQIYRLYIVNRFNLGFFHKHKHW